MAGRIRLEVTPAQLRVINHALAYYEAEAENPGSIFGPLALVRRTRETVQDAMRKTGVQP